MFEHIIIVGNGKTSRANIEALIDDYIYANPKVKFSLYSASNVLCEGQGWLKMYLIEKNIAHETVQSFDYNRSEATGMFILWGDEDPDSLLGLATAKEFGIQAFDLTDGLVLITPNDDLKVTEAPRIPVEEQLPEESEVLEQESEEDDEDEYEDALYEAVHIIAGIFAEAIAKELKKALKK